MFDVKAVGSSSDVGSPGNGSPSDDSADRLATIAVETQDGSNSQGVNVSKAVLVLGSLGLSLIFALSVFNWLPNNTTNNSDSKAVFAGKAKQLEKSTRTNGLNEVDRAKLTNSVGKPNYSQHDIANAVANKKPMSIDDILLPGGNAEPGFETNAENENPFNVEANGVPTDKKLGNNALANLAPAPYGEVIPNAELDWKLSITFNENGTGSIKLNENEISKTLIQDNASFYFLTLQAKSTVVVHFWNQCWISN